MDWVLRCQLACKSAVAMVLAYGVAMWMGWDRPIWAAFTVIVIGQVTVGLAINKGALRVGGTLLGIVVGFVVIGLFAQERWLFILALATHLAFCTYMMGGRHGPYFWFVAGLSAPVVAWDGAAAGAAAFDVGALRAQQTVLGVLAVSLVAALLWPRSTGVELTRAVREAAALHTELFRLYAERFCGGAQDCDLTARRLASLAAEGRAASLIEAAETDTYRVWEVHTAWFAYRRHFQDYWDSLGRWRQSFDDAASFDVRALLPALDAFLEEIAGRLETIEALHRGDRPTRTAADVQLVIDEAAAASLSHFDRTVLEAARVRLAHVEQTTRGMLEAVRAIYGLAPAPRSAPRDGPWLDFVIAPDPGRLNAAVRHFITAWLVSLTYLLIPDTPGGTALVITVCFLGIPLAVYPQVRMSKLISAALVGSIAAGVVYVALMPSLVTFHQLAIVLFLATFVAFAWKPYDSQFLPRTIGLAFFLIALDIENYQAYSAERFADNMLMFVAFFALLGIGRLVPCRTAPAAQIDWLLARYRGSANFLLRSLHWPDGHPPTIWHRAWRRRHLQELATIPQQLRQWQELLPPAKLPAENAAKFADFVHALGDFGFGLVDLVDARSRPQSTVFLHELGGEMRSYQVELQRALRGLTLADVRGVRIEGARSIADTRRLEDSLEALLQGPRASEIDAEHRVRLYRLLGVYREVVASVAELLKRATVVDWRRLREARF